MKRILLYAALIPAAFSSISCVHEYPDLDTPADVLVEFTFDLAAEMPELTSTYSGTKAIPDDDKHDFRYQVRAYRQLPTGGYAKEPLFEAVYIKDKVEDIHYVDTIAVQEGTYRLLAWVDYIAEDSGKDLYYDTKDFSCIGLLGDEHVANTELRDVFIGESVIEARRFGSEVEPMKTSIELYRPVGKYEIVTDDLAEFIEQQSGNSSDGKSVSLDDFYAIISYRSFMPNNFNLTTSKPDDSARGITYRSPVIRLNDNEALLGFDYVLIPEETVISISVAFYSKDGSLMTDTGAFDIPLKRGHVTKVVKKYLTGSVGGGVDIDTDFDGDNNIQLN